MTAVYAPYAASTGASRGRMHREPGPEYRSEWQRDRDRIIHSGAFRRLEYKTQVFVNHEGDMFRTRLTHSLEVAQIARTIARVLALDEDLTEAVALAHDLGHTPFGHAGQAALDECMRQYGGFEHNLQSLRIVDELEDRYAEFPGLNLMFETREGILKHCAPARVAVLGDVAARFLIGGQPALEAQVANLADEIAYNSHDIDDGLRSGLLEIDALCSVEVFRLCFDEVCTRYPALAPKRVTHEVVRRIINRQVSDLITATRERLQATQVASLDDVRRQTHPIVCFTLEMQRCQNELKEFLRRNLYEHYRVHRMTWKAKRVVVALFHAFMDHPALLPAHVRARAASDGDSDMARARVVADYIAGMTDRFAIREHERLFVPLVPI